MARRTLFDLIRSRGRADVRAHLEAHLGPIEREWNNDLQGSHGIRVARFARAANFDAPTYSTLGLGDHGLHNPLSGQPIRHELVMLLRASAEMLDASIPGLLDEVATKAVEAHHAYLRGQVIDLRKQFLAGSQMEALYVAIPIYFPKSFARCDTPQGWPVIFAWLTPIHAPEADYIARNGWSRFEDKLIETQPDMTDPYRLSVCGPAD
jgi:hypothetical protein